MRVIRDRPRSVDLDEFLARPLFGCLATASEDGPRASPVWFLWEEGAFWVIANGRTDSFPGRIEREPRCALAIVDFGVETGLVHHVGLRGQASVERFDAERARRLLARYLGPDVDAWEPRFRDTLHDQDNVLVRFEPDTVVARDQSYSLTPD
jgi:nitroimidazol reductase NimA-like FMN-containing flavoprotein (pyridoxamine 5'-phosphate oxidase superfamily)